MTEREALKLALEALEEINKLSIGENAICLPAEIDTAMDAIKEALAQPEHGWTPERIAGIARLKDAQDKKLAQRTWAGLTDEERTEMRSKVQEYTPIDSVQYGLAVQYATEAKLKEKNT